MPFIVQLIFSFEVGWGGGEGEKGRWVGVGEKSIRILFTLLHDFN